MSLEYVCVCVEYVLGIYVGLCVCKCGGGEDTHLKKKPINFEISMQIMCNCAVNTDLACSKLLMHHDAYI